MRLVRQKTFINGSPKVSSDSTNVNIPQKIITNYIKLDIILKRSKFCILVLHNNLQLM